MKNCLVLFCQSASLNISGITYHKLGKKRYSSWILAVGRKLEENLSTQNVICSRHFEECHFKYINGKRYLKNDAIPTLNLPKNVVQRKDVDSVTENEGEPAGKRIKLSSSSDSAAIPTLYLQKIALRRRDVAESVSENEGEPAGKRIKISSSSDSAGLKGSPKRNKRLIKKIHTYATTEEKMKAQLFKKQRQVKALQYKCQKHNQKLKRLRLKVIHLKQIVNSLKKSNTLSTNACSVLENSFVGVPLALMKRMIRNVNSGKVNRQKYDPVLRSFAMTLHFYSNKAYDYVRRTFNMALPSQRAIRKWFSKINCEPGFSEPAFKSLEVKVQNNKQKGYKTFGGIVMDEMHIKKHIDVVDGKSWGYVDLGTDIVNDQREYASQALVLMVVGVNGSWKLPIAYFLINSLDAEEKANIIREALIKLKTTGIIITSVTCDGPTVNFSMFTKLGANLNIQNLKPYFTHPIDGSKVYCVIDPCHLIKLFRNFFASLGKFFDDNGELVDFIYIKMLHSIQEDIGLRLGNKLKPAHLDWTKQKMKVNLAAQTLSESVASALEFLMVDLKDPRFKHAGPTIRFIRLINNIFDLLNSRNPLTIQMKMPIKESNEDIWSGVFNQALKFCEKAKNYQNKIILNTVNKTPFKGLIITVTSIRELFKEYVKTRELSYLLTYKFSQDHLELFFCSIRSRNGWNNNPSALQFFHSYRRLLLHHDIKNMSGNCTAQDETSILHTTSSPIENISVNDVHVMKRYEIDILENTINDHDYVLPINIVLSDLIENVVAYIAGYAVKMTQRTIKCPVCINSLCNHGDTKRNNLDLLFRKRWGNLIVPSEDAVAVCREVEINLRRVLFVMDNKLPNDRVILNSFVIKIYSKLLQKTSLFKDLYDHSLHNLTITENHTAKLIKTLAGSYYKIRIYNLAKTQSYLAKGNLIRKKLNKLVLFSNQ